MASESVTFHEPLLVFWAFINSKASIETIQMKNIWKKLHVKTYIQKSEHRPGSVLTVLLNNLAISPVWWFKWIGKTWTASDSEKASNLWPMSLKTEHSDRCNFFVQRHCATVPKICQKSLQILNISTYNVWTICIRFQSPPGWHYIFRLGNPNLNLLFATGMLGGGC